jgi:hypothetical protein
MSALASNAGWKVSCAHTPVSVPVAATPWLETHYRRAETVEMHSKLVKSLPL